MKTWRALLAFLAAGVVLGVPALMEGVGAESVTHGKASHEAAAAKGGHAGGLKVPEPLVREHEHLQKELAALVESGGRTEEAARRVRERLEPHFRKEEAYALPQLSLLPRLAQKDGVTSDMQAAVELGKKLRAELSGMVADHRSIVQALDELAAAGREENKPDAAAFAERLKAHAEQEEKILYPAAILVGDYVEMKLGPSSTNAPGQ